MSKPAKNTATTAPEPAGATISGPRLAPPPPTLEEQNAALREQNANAVRLLGEVASLLDRTRLLILSSVRTG